jgi:hypothetical protein
MAFSVVFDGVSALYHTPIVWSDGLFLKDDISRKIPLSIAVV